MPSRTALLEELERNGFAIVEGVLGKSEIALLTRALCLSVGRSNRSSSSRRNLLAVDEVVALSECSSVRDLINPILGEEARAVRGLLFDKTPDANWKVPWHQDVTIGVQAKAVLPGYGPWSVKAGFVHVQPPADVLQRMISVRIHLDHCGGENGPLRVLPGSHLHGRMSEAQIAAYTASRDSITCHVAAGGVLLMRPLLLHASSAAKAPEHRRVIHLDFAAGRLPEPLLWLTVGR
jgi:ectoine hydroxylase-related dioxygenase (phytanoyl-CoA dioxygenase family)